MNYQGYVFFAHILSLTIISSNRKCTIVYFHRAVSVVVVWASDLPPTLDLAARQKLKLLQQAILLLLESSVKIFLMIKLITTPQFLVSCPLEMKIKWIGLPFIKLLPWYSLFCASIDFACSSNSGLTWSSHWGNLLLLDENHQSRSQVQSH